MKKNDKLPEEDQWEKRIVTLKYLSIIALFFQQQHLKNSGADTAVRYLKMALLVEPLEAFIQRNQLKQLKI